MPINPLYDEEMLLAKVAEGDSRAFNLLFDKYYNTLGAYVLRIVKSIEIAEEIVQDTFIKVWVQRAELVNIRNISQYLFVLSRNQALDHLRKRAKEAVLAIELEKILVESENPEEINPNEEYRRLIDDAVGRLPEKAKMVFILSRYERLKYEEIAKKLNISAETVKKHLQYATAFIKKDVKNHIDLAILTVLLSPILIN